MHIAQRLNSLWRSWLLPSGGRLEHAHNDGRLLAFGVGVSLFEAFDSLTKLIVHALQSRGISQWTRI